MNTRRPRGAWVAVAVWLAIVLAITIVSESGLLFFLSGTAGGISLTKAGWV